MLDSLFTTAIVDENVTIYPQDLNSKLNETILTKIRDKLEGEQRLGKCTQYGYVKSVNSIVSKEPNPRICDSGKGECIMNIKVEIMRCLPEIGQTIECEISAYDEHIGEAISFQKPVFILIINDTEDILKVGDKVRVNVDDFLLKHGDDIMNIVSSYVGRV